MANNFIKYIGSSNMGNNMLECNNCLRLRYRCQECYANLQLLQKVRLQDYSYGSLISKCRTNYGFDRMWQLNDIVSDDSLIPYDFVLMILGHLSQTKFITA